MTGGAGPRLGGPDEAPAEGVPLLRARGVGRTFRLPRTSPFVPGPVREAVVDADLDVGHGESVALIGESGSGKSTLVRALLALDAPAAEARGTVTFDGREVRAGRSSRLLWLRRRTGIVLQDPYASLDPRMRVGDTVAEPLRALRLPGDHDRLVADVLRRVGLDADAAERWPHEFSGGQRQRIALARAIVHGPDLLVGDEPLSALDLAVRAQVLELLRELRSELGLSLLIVSHDVGLVSHLADRVAVLHAGRIVEQGTTHEVLRAPRHPYTQQLVAAVPTLD
ncbi:ABC transporter ATP-binding protein [Frigoribacterium salinisoli]